MTRTPPSTSRDPRARAGTRVRAGLALLVGALALAACVARRESDPPPESAPRLGARSTGDSPRTTATTNTTATTTTTTTTTATTTATATTAPATTILVLRASRSVEVVHATTKPTPWVDTGAAGETTWVVEDAATRVELARGSLSIPARCACPARDDGECRAGARGCVDLARHELVLRLKLPRHAARERVRLLDAGGVELCSVMVEPRTSKEGS